MKTKRLVLSIFVLSLILSVTVSAKVKVMEPSISYEGNTLSFSLMNGVGQEITITGIGARGEKECDSVNYERANIRAGEVFPVTAVGCYRSEKSAGESFSVDVAIEYDVIVAGQTVHHSSGGAIRGVMETSSQRRDGAGTSPSTGPDEITEDVEGDNLANFLPIVIILILLVLVVVFLKYKKTIRSIKKLKPTRNQVLSGLLILFVIFVAYSIYMMNLEHFVSKQQTLLFAQNEYIIGSVAATRVITLDNASGNPIDTDVEITLKPRGAWFSDRVLFRGRTSGGTADIRFDIPKDLNSGDYDLITKAGSDTIVNKIQLVKRSKILLTTDKPAYQPGQKIHIRALVLNPFNYNPYSNEEVTLEVEDSKSNKVFKSITKTNDYGICSADFTLADELNLGRYTIRAISSISEQEKNVEVKRYSLPKFRIEIQTDKDYYLPFERLKGSISVNYFFGKPVSGDVDVVLSAYEIEFKRFAHIQGKLDKDGRFDFEISLPDYFVGLPLEKGNALLLMNVSVVDDAHHKETSVNTIPISENPINIEIIPESEKLKSGLENTIYIVTTYPDGSPAETTLTVNGENIKTNKLGIGAFRIRPQTLEQYEISVHAKDSKGRDSSKTETLSLEGGNEHILLQTDKAIYNVGEKAVLHIFYSGTHGTKSVYVDVIKNKQTVLTKAIDMDGNKAQVELEISSDLVGSLEIHAYKILRSTDIVRDVRNVIVYSPRDLSIDVNPDKGVYLPGDDAIISFKVRDDKGMGVQSALGINIVDESVFWLQELRPGFEEIYFLLEKELLEPRYQIKGVSLQSIMQPDKVEDEPTDSVTEAEPILERNREDVARLYLTTSKKDTKFTIEEDTYVEKEVRIREMKESYPKSVVSVMFSLALALLILTLFYRVYWSIRNKKYKELLSSVGLCIFVPIMMILLGFAILLIVGVIPFSMNWRPGESIMMLSIAIPLILYSIGPLVLILTSMALVFIAFRPSEKNKQFWSLLVPAFSLLVIGSLIFLLMSVNVIGPFIVQGNLDRWRRDDGWNFEVTDYVNKIVFDSLSGLFERFMFISAMFNGNVIAALSFILILLAIFSLMPLVLAIPGFNLLFNNDKRGIVLVFGAISLCLFSSIALLFPVVFWQLGIFGGGPGAVNTASTWGGYASGEMSLFGPGAKDVSSEGLETAEEKPYLRQYFPETLYSNPSVITDENGEVNIGLQMADSITTWRLTSMASTLDGKLGTKEKGILVFQDFFIDIDLPRTLTQDDEVWAPVALYNYLNESQTIRLEVIPEDWYEIEETNRTVIMNANEVSVAYFHIKVLEHGIHRFTVYAYGTEHNDAISKDVEVIPDGRETFVSFSGSLDGDIDKIIFIPEESVDRASKIFVKIYPGYFSQVVDGLDNIFRMPHGCFEQTTSITYPNVLTLDYMKKTKQVSPELQMKAEGFVSAGYQRLLTFETSTPGGFSLYGRQPPVLLLTAYGLMELSDMSSVYNVDAGLLERMRMWLSSQQDKDGSWGGSGKLYFGGRMADSGLASTCFVSWSLAGSKDTGLQRAEEYIKEKLDKSSDIYTKALCANALIDIDKNDGKLKEILDWMDETKIELDDAIYWTSAPGNKEHTTFMGSRGSLKDTEVTSLMALAYMKTGRNPHDIEKVLNHIIKQKDNRGTWGSTQTTVLALKALTYAAEHLQQTRNKANIGIYINEERASTVNIDETNSDVLQLADLKEYTEEGENEVRLDYEGEGYLFYQIVGKYYLPWEKDIPEKKVLDIDLRYNTTDLIVNDMVKVDVTISYNGMGSTNLVIVDLGIPPGFSLVAGDLEEVVGEGLIDRYDIAGRQIILYIGNIEYNEPLEFNYRLKARYPIRAKSPRSRVYEYYNPNVEDYARPVDITIS